MKNLIFLLVFLTLSIVVGCSTEPDSPPQPTVQSTTICAVCDLSDSNKDAQLMTSELLLTPANMFLKQGQDVSVLATHVSLRQSNPVSLRLYPTGKLPPKMNVEYKKIRKEQQILDSLNTLAIDSFTRQFDKKITHFELTKETNYSYVNIHARSVARCLDGANATTRIIAVMASDFIDHEKGKKASSIDSTTIKLLNEALIHPNAYLFIITPVDINTTALKDLNAVFVSNWTECNLRIENIFSSPKITYHD